jgi:hypothetical protein
VVPEAAKFRCEIEEMFQKVTLGSLVKFVLELLDAGLGDVWMGVLYMRNRFFNLLDSAHWGSLENSMFCSQSEVESNILLGFGGWSLKRYQLAVI